MTERCPDCRRPLTECFFPGDRHCLRVAASALKSQAQRDTGLLLNLLARIHGDGGHRVIAVGVEQACAEADLMVAKWRAVGRK